ncbi:hypothetical protein [Aeromonas media]|uniref:hypothetical protein n=1 Tax=Aeromonas media TaxID=651 RepID=UPI00227FEFEA|nr:hypothetical protein [Aeromonas media]MCY9822535.1 hypothetical protein [Aeromonas media]
MNTLSIRKYAITLLLFMLSPIFIMYFSSLDRVALWLYAWAIPFCFILFSKKGDLFIKGLLVITYSVVICFTGSAYIIKNHPDLKDTITTLASLITLVSGGIGGNFMSHELIRLHDKSD